MGTLANSADPDETQHNASRDRNTSSFRKFYMYPLKVHTGQSHTHCINMYGLALFNALPPSQQLCSCRNGQFT